MPAEAPDKSMSSPLDLSLFPRRLADRFARRKRRMAMLRTPFYRRYPYDNPISIFEVDRRVFVSPELKVLFNGIGKAGHSSVIVNLARAQYGDEIPVGRAKSGSFQNPSTLSAAQVEELAGFFKFTLVRNPYTRTLSAYLDKVARQKVVPEGLRRRAAGRPPSFLDFCLYLDDGGLHDAVHWAPQTSMMVLPVPVLDLVAKLENFDADFRRVLEAIGLGDRFEVSRHDPHKTDSDRKRAEYYCDRSREIVARLLAEDFRLLGYSPD
jgi:hypothetical protein